MELREKLDILASAAKYDASCATSGSDRRPETGRKGGFGVAVSAGVCHSWSEDGRCVSMLKVLYSNVCIFDCAYCANRASAEIKRAIFSPEELITLTTEFYRRNYVEGLFLSSGVFADPDLVMGRLVEVARRLRTEAGFGGYIHLKIIPGAGKRLLEEAGRWADRLSANIELPTEKSLKVLAPQKSRTSILGAMRDFREISEERVEDRRHLRRVPEFAPGGQSTQLIIGATGEDDRQILDLSGALYRKYALRRVYYSAYVPVVSSGRADPRDTLLPELPGPPLVREHRLYQADWLLRFYRFNTDEILDAADPYLDAYLDPKTSWALRHLDFYPVEATRADYEELLRIPGVGVKSARRILELRRSRPLSFDGLRRLGVTLKRARYFMTVSGSFLDRPEEPERLRRILSDSDGAGLQLPLFEF